MSQQGPWSPPCGERGFYLYLDCEAWLEWSGRRSGVASAKFMDRLLRGLRNRERWVERVPFVHLEPPDYWGDHYDDLIDEVGP